MQKILGHAKFGIRDTEKAHQFTKEEQNNEIS